MISNLRMAAEEEIPTFSAEGMIADPQPAQPRGTKIASDAVFLALRALSQRAVIALAGLTDLALVGSAFVLWLRIITNPSILQLVGVGLYAVFILLAVMLRGKA